MSYNHGNISYSTFSLNIPSDGLTPTSINSWTTEEQELLSSTSSDFSTQYHQSDNYGLYDDIQVEPLNLSADINYLSVITGNNNAVFDTSFFREITDENRDLLTGGLVNSDQSGVETAVAIAHDSLVGFFSQPNLTEKMQIPFGDNFDQEKLAILVQDVVSNNSVFLSDITILPDNVLKNANGAFNSDKGSIYLSSSFVTQNDPNAIANVFLEEVGHYIDSKINVVDSPGDEGEIFALISQGRTIPEPVLQKLRNEDDKAFIKLNNQITSIEQSGSENNMDYWRYDKTIDYMLTEMKENPLTHILHLEKEMSKPQLRARGINRLISSKRRDTTIFGKNDSRAVWDASPQSGGNGNWVDK